MKGNENLNVIPKKAKMNRRDFLVAMSAAGVSAALGISIRSPLVQAKTPSKGGVFRYALQSGSTSDTLDPLTIVDEYGRNINWQLRNCLTEIDHKGEVIPELAETWESTPDATQWIFNIRKGVDFHNGKTLVAEDVIYSINRHRGENSKSVVKSFVEPITEIKSDGKYTVMFNLDSGNADFPFLMSTEHLSIIPKETTDVSIGTGGYQLVQFEPGVKCITKRNPNYWKNGRAHFNEVETLVIADVVARTNAIKTGSIDAMAFCDSRTAKLMEKWSNVEVLQSQGGKHGTYPMLMDVPPYDNQDVRLALKYAIDRKQIVKIALSGFGNVGNDHPIAPYMRFFASELPQREYDPDKARFHIKKAGMQNYTFKLHTAQGLFANSMDASLLYKEHAARAGINIQVVQEAKDGYWSNVWLKKPWCQCQWSARPTEDLMFTSAYAESAPWNDTHWNHERFNRLLKEARSELDKNKRKEMYFEMQRILRDEGGVVIPFFFDFIDAASTKIAFDKIASNYEMDGSRCAERWWFAS